MTDTSDGTPASCREKSQVEKQLMEASGVQKQHGPREELLELRKRTEQCFEAMMTKTEEALRAAEQTQQSTDRMFRQLKEFCSKTLPADMEKALERMAQDGFNRSFKPLEESVRRAALEIEDCRMRYSKASWEWRLLMGPALTGLLVAILSFSIMYYHFFGKSYRDEARYAEWGRRVEAEFLRYPPQQREKVFRYYGRP